MPEESPLANNQNPVSSAEAPVQQASSADPRPTPSSPVAPTASTESARPGDLKDNKKRIRRWVIWSIIILLAAFGLFFLFRYSLTPKATNLGNGVNVEQPAKSINTSIKNNLATTTDARQAKAIAESENYKLTQISLEGSGTETFDLGENELLSVSNITSELISIKQGETSEIRAVIKCLTNKRAYIEVEYSKSGEKDKKVIKDDYPGFSHLLVLPDLVPDSVYKYSLIGEDLNQAQANSDQYVFYTGVGNISLVDILGNAVQRVFGWAMAK